MILHAKAYYKLPNEFNYQGNYSEEEEESGYDEFASPYLGMGNDPVNNVDPDGGLRQAF